MALFRHNRLWMELYTFDGQCFVPNAHDFFHRAIVITGPGGDFQAIRKGVFVDHQAVIAGRLQRVAQATENALVLMVCLLYTSPSPRD